MGTHIDLELLQGKVPAPVLAWVMERRAQAEEGLLSAARKNEIVPSCVCCAVRTCLP